MIQGTDGEKQSVRLHRETSIYLFMVRSLSRNHIPLWIRSQSEALHLPNGFVPVNFENIIITYTNFLTVMHYLVFIFFSSSVYIEFEKSEIFEDLPGNINREYIQPSSYYLFDNLI